MHLEAEDAVDHLKQSSCHKCEGTVSLSRGTRMADTISKDVNNVEDTGNITQYSAETITQM